MPYDFCSQKLYNETGNPVLSLLKSHWEETETTTWWEFPNGGIVIVEQILASEQINKSKIAGLWVSNSGIWVGKLTIWVRSLEIEKL